MQLLRTERIGSHLNIAARRSTVVPHFVLKDGLQVVLSQLQASRTPKVVQDAYPDKYSDMLQKAEACTFMCPKGQLHGKAGRRCTLEDGERILDWCIEERPWDLQPRVIQLRNLMKQSLGREREVPQLAIRALQETDVQDCNISSESYIKVLQTVLLGLKAIYKLELAGDTIPSDAGHPPYTLLSFLQTAQQAVPGMSQDLLSISQRLHRQLSCCGAEKRRQLLFDRDGFMSNVDLQAVSGEHHVLIVDPRDGGAATILPQQHLVDRVVDSIPVRRVGMLRL